MGASHKHISSFRVMVLALFLLVQEATGHGGMPERGMGSIGAIVDCSSRAGKEAKVAMEMAIHDFHIQNNRSFVLHVINSQGEAMQAAHDAAHLIKAKGVQALLGPQEWEEASLVAEIGCQYHVPLLSLAESTPPWATQRWPFLIQASPSQQIQTKAVAAIVQSWAWRRVILIYEDMQFPSIGFIRHFFDALRKVGAEVSHSVALLPFALSALSEELEKLKQEQCRVFVVHLSLPLALRLFVKAKEMRMMEKDYVWITTASATSLIHSVKASTTSPMQGVLGVKIYFPETQPRFQDFNRRFSRRFSSEHPEEESHEPGIFAVQAYDALWAVALAMEDSNRGSQALLEKISSTNFSGLTGKVQFSERKLPSTNIFQIINLVTKGYRELGFWSDGLGLGFSKAINGEAMYKASMEILGQVIWPGEPRYTPRGWTLPTTANPLRIGVPDVGMPNPFVNVEYDPYSNNYSVTGFSISVFKETVKRLPYSLPYHFISWNGTYDDLVKQVHQKNFDAAVGDIAILSRRYEYVEFTHAYTESGLVMVVPVQSHASNKTWLFMKPFTRAMWVLITFINVYNGFVVWMIERNHCPELKGSALNQLGILIWLTFGTLFSLHGEKMHSNLSRMATIVWLFVALIITQSYTASLASMLTVQRLEPKVADTEILRNSNAMVGYLLKPFIYKYLVDVLYFKRENVKNFSSMEGFAEALRNGEIAAVFLEVSQAKLFVAKYCKSFITAGPTFKVGGYGFAFPRRFPMLPDIDQALLNVSESGVLRELEDSLNAAEKCVDVESDGENVSIGPNSFWIPFMLTGSTSTAALAICVLRGYWRDASFKLYYKSIWTLILVTMEYLSEHKNKFSRKVGDVGSLRSPTEPTL